MIKIVKAKYIDNYNIELSFSTSEVGVMDFEYLFEKETTLTKSLKDKNYFKDFFIELGAIGWKNGLELSPKSLYEKLQSKNLLKKEQFSA